jgi:sec-independent protein translocase protein TatB
MFDVSFSELIVIAVVALIVIGPEKLPKVARTLGAIAGRMQRYVAQVKEEVNREVRFQELQQLQQEIQDTVTKTKDSIASGLQASVDKVNQEVEEFKLEAANPKVPDEIAADKKQNVRKSRAKKASIQE